MAVEFGTSGLRGPAAAFDEKTVGAYVAAFLGEIVGSGPVQVFVGADLRESSPRIAGFVMASITAAGFEPVFAGHVPTPALAMYAMARKCPAVMITGSHIPETYNGIKFYRRDGELLKSDEPIMRAKAGALSGESASKGVDAHLPEPRADIARAYVGRYADAFGAQALEGLRLGVDLHSAVGRDLLVEILERLGAIAVPFRRSDRFIAVDTEAVAEQDLERARDHIAQEELDAVVSTDGDGDRPLLIGADGQQIIGDILGLITAKQLGIETVVTPLTSTSAVEMTGWFGDVVRTKIGSPYVVAAMTEASGKIAGFEANGGFLLGSDVTLGSGVLAALPTRDAVLPLIATLMAGKRAGGMDALVAALPRRVMLADRIKNVTPERGVQFVQDIAVSDEIRRDVHERLDNVVDINQLDGTRFTLSDGVIVHFRQSGNAPELRCYVETNSSADSRELLDEIMAALSARL